MWWALERELKAMGFDQYLQSQGYERGARLDPQQAWFQYNQYSAQQEPQQGGGGAVGMASIGKMFGGGGMGGGGDSGGDSGGGMGGGSWGGAFGGAMAGVQAGNENYRNDPNMRNKRDGFGTKYRDSRAEVGGAALGGVMGYYGLGALAGPAVKAAHPVMEPATRWAINTGDSFGGAGGAMLMDPFGTVASGKYSGEELAWGATLGPAAKWFGII
jgi:hypothetical protein